MLSRADIETLLATHLGVDPAYVHRPKEVTVRDPVIAGSALLKWYEVHAPGAPVPEEVRGLAQAAFRDGRLAVEGFGFVVLHRCGESFHFLIASTWRNENELWQAVWYRDGAMERFEEFPRDGGQKPTFCVWELVPVLHEQRAWERFLRSPRDAAAAEHWLAERYQGPA